MREFNALKDYPQPPSRTVGERTIEHRIIASYRGREFFDGDRAYGYGGMVNDGRWKAVAQCMAERYGLKSGSRILQFHCEKGYLLAEFKAMDMEVCGIEPSPYARRHCAIPALPALGQARDFDLVIAIGTVYMENLPDAMAAIRRIESLGFASFITLASYDTEEDLALLRKWSLLGTTILRKDEWKLVLTHCGYTGDYWFVNAETLRLRAA